MIRPLRVAVLPAALAAGLLHAQTIQPAGVISGVVTDELNRPVPGVGVTAFRLTASGQLVEPKTDPNNPFTAQGPWADGAIQKDTNDLGEFRLWPLEAGEYVVAVVVSRFTRHVDENFGGCVPPYPRDLFGFVPVVRAEPVEWLADASRRYLVYLPPALTPPEEAPERGYVTTFSPRAVELTEARRVILADKQQEAGVDIQLQLRRAVRVTGRIAGAKVPDSLDVELTGLRGGSRARTTVDGSFAFVNVPVGTYSLVSTGMTSTCDTRGSYGPSYQGRAEVRVEAGDQNHFTLTVGPQPSVERGPTQTPPIETRPDAGAIEGIVTSDAGQPLDRVRVAVTSSALPKGATAVTASDGRFVIDNLPPDVFTLTVSRAGYADHLYGQRRPGGENTRIQLGARQRVTANVVMPRPGVIAGTIRNERGAPMSGVSVCCHATAWTDADDRGQYRLWPVPAGDRTVLAYDARGRGVLKGYLRTYYPGATDEASAQKVRVDPGTVRVIDIEPKPLTTGPGASLTVRIQTAERLLGTNEGVYIGGVYSAHQRAVPSPETTTPSELVATFLSVPAGKHFVSVGPNSGDRLYGSAEIATDGRTPATVTIVMVRKPALNLSAVFDGPGERTKYFQWKLFRVTDSPAWNSVTVWQSSGDWLDAAGRASMSGLRAGRYVLRIEPEGAWTAASARLNGREILDGPFTLEEGATAELAVTFTSRRTSFEGIVRDATGAPVAISDVLIFSVDRQFWTPGSRRIRLVRPRSDGHYDVSGLPPGEYAVVAEQQIVPDDVDPVWLQSRLAGAARVTLSEATKQELAIRVR